MSKRQLIELAENIVEEYGNVVVFTRNYIEARQTYDVETSLEMALEQQNLLTVYKNKTQELNYI